MAHLKFTLIYTAVAFFLFSRLQGQDTDSLQEKTGEMKTEYATATFASTRIINGHSVERMPAGLLELRINHRFGEINTGAYNLWGLDQANTHFSLEYGITNWLMVGLGRGTYEKTYDGYLKFTLLRQSKGARNMPVSFSLLTSTAYNTLKLNLPGLNEWDRMSYVAQLLIARKFNNWFSFQISPTYVHRNMVATELDPNDLWSLGGGFRAKITKRLSFNAEYYYVFPPRNNYQSSETYNPLSLGVDIQTSGHVFSIMITNSLAMIEKAFIGETTGKWQDGGIHLGFNISRVFTIN